MNHLARIRRAAALLAAAIATASVAVGQTLPPSRTASDEVIRLEEFNVAASATNGYRATNSITATGIGVKISEVPIPISVVTGELIRDVQADTLSDALKYVPGLGTSPRNESTFIVRGFSGLISYRNGQYRRQLFTTYNVERIEVAKGAAGIFFGTVRPGGVINYITAKPKFDVTYTDARVTVGSDDYYKFEVTHNQPLTKNLAVLANVGVIDAGGDKQFEFLRETYGNVTLTWKPRENQSLTFEVEGINRSRFYQSSYGSRAISNSRYLFNPAVPAANQVTTTAASHLRSWLNSQGFSGTPGTPTFVPTFDIFAPVYGPTDPEGRTISITNDARQTQKSRTLDLSYLLKITDSLVWQTDLNQAYDNTTGLQPNNGNTNPYADGSLRFNFEHFINIRDSWNADTKLTYRVDALGGNHTFQLGGEFQKVNFLRPGYFSSNNSRYNNSPLGANIFNFRAGVDAPVSTTAGMTASGQDFNIRRTTYEEQTSYFFAGQSRFLQERLFVIYGTRYNEFSQTSHFSRPVTNTQLAPGVLSNYDEGRADPGWTPQAAVLYKLTPEVSVFVNASRAVEPNASIDADGNASEPIESKSTDFGIKTELFAGRLVSTVTVYDLERGNLAFRDTVREATLGRTPFFIFGNTEASQGLEAEINWSPTDNYQLIVAANHFRKAEVTKSNDPNRVGAPLNYNPENSYTVWNRYEFRDGPAKGLAIGAGLRHSDAARMSGDPQNIIEIPSFTVFDLMISKRFVLAGRNVKAQLNVKNLTDKLYREGSDGFFAPKRGFFLSLGTRF